MPRACSESVCFVPSRAGNGIQLDVSQSGAPIAETAAIQFLNSRAMFAYSLDVHTLIAIFRRPILVSTASSPVPDWVADRSMRRFQPDVPARLRIYSPYQARTGNTHHHSLACCVLRPIVNSLSSPFCPKVDMGDAPRLADHQRSFWRPSFRRNSRFRANCKSSLSLRTARQRAQTSLS